MAFKEDVKHSFTRAREDMETLKEQVVGWIGYLNAENEELKGKLKQLEKRATELEIQKAQVMRFE